MKIPTIKDNTRKSKTIRFRMSSTHYDRLKNLAEAKGFTSMSEYLRFAALEKDVLLEIQLNGIYEAVINIKKKLEVDSKRKKIEDTLI